MYYNLFNEFKLTHYRNAKYCEISDLAIKLLSIHFENKNTITLGVGNLVDIKPDYLNCTLTELLNIYKEIILMINFYYVGDHYIKYIKETQRAKLVFVNKK